MVWLFGKKFLSWGSGHYRGRQSDVLKLHAREGLSQRGGKPPALGVFSAAVLRYQAVPELCYPKQIWVL